MKHLLHILTIAVCLFGILAFSMYKEDQKKNQLNEDKHTKTIDSLKKVSINLSHLGLYDSCYHVSIDIYYILKPLGKIEKGIAPIKEIIASIKDTSSINHKMEMRKLLYYFYENCGRIHEAFNVIEDVHKFALINKDSALIAETNNSIGLYYLKTRNYDEGLKYLQYSLNLSEKLHDTNNIERALPNYGIALFYNKKFEKSREVLSKAIIRLEDYFSFLNTEISRSYLIEGNIKKAKEHLNLAIKRAEEEKDNEMISECFKLYGEIYKKENNLKLASVYYEKSFQLCKKLNDTREIIKTAIPYAKNELQLNNVDKAISLLEYCNELFDYKRKMKNDKALPVEMNLIEVFANLGRCYDKKYELTKNASHLNSANQYYYKSIQILEDMRKYHTNPFAVENISSDTKYIYEAAIDANLHQYTLTNNEKYKDKAFLIYQKYGGFNLKKSVAERKALDLSEKNEFVKNNYLKLKIDLQNELYKLNAEYNDSLYQVYELSKKKYEQIRDSLLKHNNRFRKLNEDIKYIDSKSIQKKLDNQTQFISYFMGVDNLYRFVIEKNKFTIDKIKNDSTLSKNASTYLDHLSNPDIKNQNLSQSKFFSASNVLYKSLIPSTGDYIKKMIIIPDGFLYRLPFEAFTSRLINEYNENDAYLISKYSVNYLYYPAQMIKEEDKNIEKYFFSMGLEYDKYTLENMEKYKQDTIPEWINDKFRSDALSHLYYADDEALTLSSLFNGDAIVNENATKENFVKQVPSSGILHVSAHSCVDFEDPQNSAIILTKKGESDNLVSYNDIATMDLNTQLVTLSACNSSVGQISSSEGVSSLTKAFFEAGSKSVVGSFWSVPDQLSKIFMEVFYKKMKEGMKKDEALRAAKMEIMSKKSPLVNEAYKSPAYWAAWNIYGDVSPLEIESGIKWWWIGAAVLLIIVLILFYHLKRKHRSV